MDFLVNINGVPFYMPDSRHQTGRRVQRFFFPGQDVTAYQDLGALDGPMRVQGLIVGDDYVDHAQALEAALRTPGPGTLVHPWYGALAMVLTEPASITFSQRELRVVKFDATFSPFYPNNPAPSASLDDLLGDIADGFAAAQAFLAAVLAPIGTAVWLAGQLGGFFGSLQSYWQANTGALPIFGAFGNPQLAAACAPAVAALATVESIAPGATYAAGVFAMLAAVPQAIASASATLRPSAVGPGDAAAGTAPIDGRITMGVLLAASSAALAGINSGTPPITSGLALTEAAIAAIAAAQAATTIAWDSAQEAGAALGTLVAAHDAVAAQAAVAAVPTVSTTSAAVAAGQLWAAIESVRQALIADMNAAIGRLPQVIVMTTLAQMSAWTLANILAGDTPALIFPTYRDLVTRNGVRNPAIVAAGTLEFLAPASLPTLLPGVSAA